MRLDMMIVLNTKLQSMNCSLSSGEPMSWHLLLTCCVERHIEMEPGYLICILITVTYFKGYFTNYCAGLNDCEPQPLFPISEKPKNLDAEMVSILICGREWL